MKTESYNYTQRLVSALPEWSGQEFDLISPVVGILPGEGVGPEVMDVTLDILQIVNRALGNQFEVLTGGKIGLPAQLETGRTLTRDIIGFCDSVFSRQGAVLCGPGGGRFVYDLRAHFDLFCKFTPIRPVPALGNIGVLKPEALQNVDMVIVRENTGGLYFGNWQTIGDVEKSALHSFEYKEAHVRRILKTAINLAQIRKGKLTVVLKPGGVPAISSLWLSNLGELTTHSGISQEVLEVDNAMYQLVANAKRFDVVVAPNMFGDILSDGSSLLLGSRGLSFSGNFGTAGHAVYQTGHGAAHDLAGTNTANPIGQIFSLAMMLRESFGLYRLANAVDAAVAMTLRGGWRTADISTPGDKLVGTQEMGRHIAANLENILGKAVV